MPSLPSTGDRRGPARSDRTGDLGVTASDASGNLLSALGLTTGATLQRGDNAQFTVNGGPPRTSTVRSDRRSRGHRLRRLGQPAVRPWADYWGDPAAGRQCPVYRQRGTAADQHGQIGPAISGSPPQTPRATCCPPLG